MMADRRRCMVRLAFLFLASVLTSAFAPLARADLALELSAAKTQYQEGETLGLTIAGHNDGASATGNLYLVFVDPGGNLFSFTAAGWRAGLSPWIPKLSLPGVFDLPATAFMSFPLPSAALPISSAGVNYFALALLDDKLQPVGSALSVVAFIYVDLKYLEGSWRTTPRYPGDVAGNITYSFAIYGGQPRFTMGGRAWGVGVELVFGRYALGDSGLLTYTLESHCTQVPVIGWFACEPPYLQPYPVPEIYNVRYSIQQLKGLGYEFLIINSDRGIAEQQWHVRGLDYTRTASGIGSLAGEWRCLSCSFPTYPYHQMLIHRSGSGYRFHWADDVFMGGGYQGVNYFAGKAELVGSALRLTPDTNYQCPSTVYQSSVELFLVEPGLLAGCRSQEVTGQVWDVPIALQANPDGSTGMSLSFGGGILGLTRTTP